MLQRKLKNKLKEIDVPSYDVEIMKRTIERAKKLVVHPEKLRLTNFGFFLNQLRFIQKETWVLKVIFTVLITELIIHQRVDTESWMWPLVAILGPVMCLINSKELCNLYRPGLLEIQMVARNSLQKTLMVRLMTFGIADIIVFLLLLAVITTNQSTFLWQMLIYAIVPYNLMTFGCMKILNKQDNENTLLYCIAWGVILVSGIFLLKTSGSGIFSEDKLLLWSVAGIFSILGAAEESFKFIKSAGGNCYDIEYRTLI